MAKLYDEGTYRARAVSGVLGENNKGNTQALIKFTLLDFPNEHITYFGHFTEKTEESTLRALRTAGLQGNDLTDMSSLSREDAPEVHLVIENEPYTNSEGKTITQSKVRWVNAPTAALKSNLDPNKAKAFAAKMRAKFTALDVAEKARNRGAGGTNGAAQSQRGAPDTEESPFTGSGAPGTDDIPF